MTKSKTVWFGMKLTPTQKQKIKLLAEREGTSAKEAVMRQVERALAVDGDPPLAGSFLSGIEDLIGSVSGPGDLSSNPEHMRDFGRSR